MDDKKLTKQERDFATKWHGVIYTFLNENGLPESEYYDVAALGYLRAVMRYNREPKLRANIPALKEYVYELIKMTTQKTAGQRAEARHDISWDELEMTLFSVVIEATALVLSGDLDKLEEKHNE